jgi:hypothetical protein
VGAGPQPPNPQSPIPNPQSPIILSKLYKNKKIKLINFFIKIKIIIALLLILIKFK